jgi:hypothetical protein
MRLTFCAGCPLRKWAERRPASWLARLWVWHTSWCPGWSAYQRSLQEPDSKAPVPRR